MPATALTVARLRTGDLLDLAGDKYVDPNDNIPVYKQWYQQILSVTPGKGYRDVEIDGRGLVPEGSRIVLRLPSRHVVYVATP